MVREYSGVGSYFCHISRPLGALNTLFKHFVYRCRQMLHLSPSLAHQVVWNRFVNVRGGAGKNIPHVNKQLKYIIQNMGPNLIKKALQRAARSVSTLQTMYERFDRESAVPHTTSAHATKLKIGTWRKPKSGLKKRRSSISNTKALYVENFQSVYACKKVNSGPKYVLAEHAYGYVLFTLLNVGYHLKVTNTYTIL